MQLGIDNSSSDTVAYVVIAYENPIFVDMQIRTLMRFCHDTKYDIIIADNSREPMAIVDRIGEFYNEAQYGILSAPNSRVSVLRVEFDRNDSSVDYNNPSINHAMALNDVWKTIRDNNYSKIVFLDHDCFAIKPFNFIGTLGPNVMAGIGQQKTKMYLWVGLLFMNAEYMNNMLVDFNVCHEHGLDTGGQMWRIVENLDAQGCLRTFDEHVVNAGDFSYSLIHRGTFMHFTNGSNWKAIDADVHRRINEQKMTLLQAFIEHDESQVI